MTTRHFGERSCGMLTCAVLLAVGCGSSDSGGSGTGGATATGGTLATGGTMAAAGTGAMAGTGGAAGTAATNMPLPLTDPMVMACVTDAVGRGNTQSCAECACQNCLPEVQAVYDNPDADFTMKAGALVTCGQTTCCASTSCYCGSDVIACIMTPAGPCVAEVEAAAGGMGVLGVMTPCGDPTTACGAANAFGRCVTGDPMPLSGMPIPGKCTAECMMCTPTP